MRIRIFGAGVLSVIAGMLFLASCFDGPYAECYSDTACPRTMKCIAGSCLCESPTYEFCCSKLDDLPEDRCWHACMHWEQCREKSAWTDGVTGSTGGAVSSSGSGGVGGAAGAGGSSGGGGVVEAECATDSDCPQPPDKRCGKGTCVMGACSLKIQMGPIASQVYGDCQQLACDGLGNVVEVADPSDYYEDSRPCTYDYCQGGEPKSAFVPDGNVCPGIDVGYCLQGDCVECIWDIPGASNCKSPGLECDERWCEPVNVCSAPDACGGFCKPCEIGVACNSDINCKSENCAGGICQFPTCQDAKTDGQETDVDCGGPLCPPCSAGSWCLKPSDCESDVCVKGKCHAPACTDGKKNGSELGVDCGGPCNPC
jgi:hypothetical protein